MTYTSKMRMVVQILGGITVGLSALIASAHAIDPSSSDPKAILNAVSQSQLPSSSLARMKMSIKDSTGTRERVFSMRSKRYPDGLKMLFLAEAPADVRNTAILTVNYKDPERADDQWMFLPKLSRVTRVAQSSKADPIMGSDVSMSDLSLSNQEPNDFDVKLIDGAGKLGAEDCWIIESVPRRAAIKRESGYEKIQVWISKQKLVALQFKGWLVDGKRTKYFKASELRSIDGIWSPQRMTMRTLEGSTLLSETVIDYLNLSYNSTEVTDSDFTQQRLEQGV